MNEYLEYKSGANLKKTKAQWQLQPNYVEVRNCVVKMAIEITKRNTIKIIKECGKRIYQVSVVNWLRFLVVVLLLIAIAWVYTATVLLVISITEMDKVLVARSSWTKCSLYFCGCRVVASALQAVTKYEVRKAQSSLNLKIYYDINY